MRVASTPDDTTQARRPARRLAAILAADVAGFSRLMGIDERGTFERLKALRAGIVDPAVAGHAGRIVKLMGDGLLVEFASAVDAVECAIAVQRGMAASHGDVADDRRVQVRIGINLGDIMVEGRDIYGDGVNVAARIEALAEPGGIAVSEDVQRHVRGKIDTPFEDLGERQLKNIAVPVHVYQVPARFFTGAAAGPAAALMPQTPAVPADKPSVVVLPLENMSGDPEQTYFSDGLAEDLITDLSKIAGLFVIARNTAFTYRGKALDLKEVCRELSVRFALEGSVRRAGNRVRITTQLIDGLSGGHLWAERYDRELTDIFAVQDEVTREIVAALKVHLTPAERRAVDHRGTHSIEAYDRFSRGRQLFWQMSSREGIAQAQALYEEALRLDPAFSMAQAYLAFTHLLQYVNRWAVDPQAALARAQEAAEWALALDPTEAEAHWAQGVIHLWQRKVDQAIADAERAIALDPNFARGYGSLGEALHYAGRSEEALEHFATMARLDPHYPPQYQHFMAQSEFAIGRFEEAAQTLRTRLARQESDGGHVLLAACYGHLGRAEEARVEWQEALRMTPDYSLEHRRKLLPYKEPADFDRIIEGLRKAGIAV